MVPQLPVRSRVLRWAAAISCEGVPRAGQTLGMISTLLISHLVRLASAQTPIQYKAIQQANQAAIDAEERAKKRRKKQAEDDKQDRQQWSDLLNQMNGGGAGGAGGRRRQADNPSAVSNAVSQNTGIVSGKLEPCGSVPAKVQTDLQTMMEFRKSCSAANKGSDQKFAINEYRNSLGTPTMYLFDSSGECKYKTSVSYGSGQIRGSSEGGPKACATKNSHSTPPGMHLTVPHSGVREYNQSNSLGLAGLEDQGSNGRGILIHGSNSPGEGYSYGCSGVGKDCIGSVMSFLGYGALVFNSFDDDQSAPGCSSSAGLKRNGTCRAEVAVNASSASPGGATTGGGTGAAR